MHTQRQTPVDTGGTIRDSLPLSRQTLPVGITLGDLIHAAFNASNQASDVAIRLLRSDRMARVTGRRIVGV